LNVIRIETGGITSFVEALQASMSETLDHTPPLSHVNVRCQLTLVNLYAQRDQHLLAIESEGRCGWKRTSGYYDQAYVENVFSRFKRESMEMLGETKKIN